VTCNRCNKREARVDPTGKQYKLCDICRAKIREATARRRKKKRNKYAENRTTKICQECGRELSYEERMAGVVLGNVNCRCFDKATGRR